MAKLISRSQLSKLAKYLSTQAAVQILGFAGGLLLVRYMNKFEYGLYTLSMYVLGATSVMTDLGIASGMFAIGGRMHRNRAHLGALLSDGLGIQKKLALGALAVLVPLATLLFLRQGATSIPAFALALLSVLPAFVTTRNLMRMNLARLISTLKFQQSLDLLVSITRLVCIVAAVFMFLDAITAAFINFLGFIVSFFILKWYMKKECLPSTIKSDGRHSRELWSIVRRQSPNSLYYLLSGQIATLLVSILGNADRVADIGALGRLSMIFTLIASVMTAITLPNFSQAETQSRLVGVFATVSIGFALLFASLILLSEAIPGKLLWILGNKYAGLESELTWMVAATTLSAWAGALYGLGCARAWITPASISIPAGLLTMAIAVRLVDMSSVRGAFILNTAAAVIALVINSGYICFRLYQHRTVNQASHV